MKIAVDIDGTLTDFEKFISDNKAYLRKRYGLSLTNHCGYDVDQMFEIEGFFLKRGDSALSAKQKSESIMDDFWRRYYFKYCVMTRFRKGVKETINELTRKGRKVYIVSSRKKTCEKSILGRLVKYSTIIKFKVNKITYTDIVFLPTDEEKIEYIKENGFHLLIDDKPSVISEVSRKLPCICIESGYNKVSFGQNIERVSSFETREILNMVDKLDMKTQDEFNNGNSGESAIKTRYRACFTETCYKILRLVVSPIVRRLYRPIILNKENVSTQKPIIYAPNHRKTLDPFFVVLSSKDAIHWVALKRFFTAEDSIFNNSKNPILCRLTAIVFKSIGAIPVERGGDTGETISQVNNYLEQGSCIGIFPEGTTNKNPDDAELLEMKTGVLHFAKTNRVCIQPVAIVWFPRNRRIKNRVIVNYRPSFSMEELTIEEGMKRWSETVLEGINQNKEVIANMVGLEDAIGSGTIRLST